ncbi:PA2169 family four-helix-bundle protein [Pseudomonas sp. ZM23]|uniref:PA2169 family four-helix-bundle protein n=1 Tax=Pseudomonas triclosanedens TaxID=2961893 RepID=A0ABY6ZXX5_9PSED|nr:PA2169 family four-helix-bundle protein [Pseudomonas triclosanedens]MCP8462469.1 PA2169 family four-helix-bundle protein [Pseudomonas triclosanedens]MCP8468107.1 PA2169 family four-helix-bundle protein [Pseudomonas triclosanedens]MCP8474866.1 PA2169 family four-helix-bundle protein [Pseudomonas triclosanedens]WAI49663.1 PA2169 family four-helix-bundle protein [Pseudomonas triclosanedens]
MNSAARQLNELIEIARDGQRFYQQAVYEVSDPRLQELFEFMIRAKTAVIDALSSQVAASNETLAAAGTLLGRLRQVYAETRASLASDEEALCVAQLEEAEDRILLAFEDALHDGTPETRALLRAEFPKVRACHDQLSQLKHSLG